MAARYIENCALLCEVEATQNTDATPTGADNAVLASKITITPLDATNVDRDLMREYFGASEQLTGLAVARIQFTTELAGSGTAGTAPAWGALLQAAGFAETDETAYVSYQPAAPSAQKSASLYFYDSGVLHKLLGAKGTLRVGMRIGEIPVLEWDMVGLYSAPTATGVAAATLTPWKKPEVVRMGKTTDIKLGCTYAAAALSDGTLYPSRGLSLDIGNQVNHSAFLSAEYIDIDDRQVTGAVEFDLTAAQEVTFAGTVRDNTTQSLGIEHGTAEGYIVGVFLPAAQLINYRKAELNRRRLIGFDLRAVPVAGNDDILFYVK